MADVIAVSFDGKPHFTNEISRKTEALRRLAGLNEYAQATKKLDDLTQRRTAKGSEITYLSNQFSATKSLSRLYASWLSRDTD